MKNGVRIFLVCLVLLGGTALFGYQSFNLFNNALDDLSASSLALLSPSPLIEEAVAPTASTSEETLAPTASASEETISNPEISTASTSLQQADLKPSFTFPKINDKVYIGCMYRLSFESSIQPSTATHSLETVLVDAGAREVIKPSASGLMRENEIRPDSQILDWKVGPAWPGKYYIKVSSAGGADSERSNVFTISNIPKDIDVDEKEKICEKSGGSFTIQN